MRESHRLVQEIFDGQLKDEFGRDRALENKIV